ncbi:MAG TPA: glycine--tRNA ligase [Saprospiraceae bacterium]|nr:glycine--tRNA ligase [Saprospiraceae bacterium]
MANPEDQFKKIVSHCKEYGFIFQSSEIYDGLSAVYDYGPYGVELKNNIKQYWWKSMVQMHDNIVGIDTAIFMHPSVWKASGHVDAFNDPLIDNKDSKKRYRADQLIEDHLLKLEKNISKVIESAKKKYGDIFDQNLFVQTDPQIKEAIEKFEYFEIRYNVALGENNLNELKTIIEELNIVCEVSGTRNWTEVRQFNLMFSTQLGNITGEEEKLYLRPETAQGIFVNFQNVQKSTRQKIPFGIAQIGKAFRNEIVARQFIFRMREFEQMEMQFFVKPGDELKWYEYWKETRIKWHLAIGTPETYLRFHDHIKLAHYANAAVDIEFEFPFGFKELEGIHSRTDFDLKQHAKLSGKKLQYFDTEVNENFIPFVVETSLGCDRMFLALMSLALTDEIVPDSKGNESIRTVLKLHPALAPVKCAVFPLVKNNEELTKLASKLYNELKFEFKCQYDEKDAVGKRYRRQDAIGTPCCVTVDFESLEDGCVTIRDRDSLLQERISIDKVAGFISEKVDMKVLL